MQAEFCTGGPCISIAPRGILMDIIEPLNKADLGEHAKDKPRSHNKMKVLEVTEVLSNSVEYFRIIAAQPRYSLKTDSNCDWKGERWVEHLNFSRNSWKIYYGEILYRLCELDEETAGHIIYDCAMILPEKEIGCLISKLLVNSRWTTLSGLLTHE